MTAQVFRRAEIVLSVSNESGGCVSDCLVNAKKVAYLFVLDRGMVSTKIDFRAVCV